MPQKSKQEVWQAAQIEGVDNFISAIAKAFPDAIEVVHVQAITVMFGVMRKLMYNHCINHHPPPFNPLRRVLFLSYAPWCRI